MASSSQKSEIFTSPTDRCLKKYGQRGTLRSASAGGGGAPRQVQARWGAETAQQISGKPAGSMFCGRHRSSSIIQTTNSEKKEEGSQWANEYMACQRTARGRQGPSMDRRGERQEKKGFLVVTIKGPEVASKRPGRAIKKAFQEFRSDLERK